MGVYGLLGYMEKKVPNGCYKVNVLSLARNTPGDKYLVIDLLNVQRSISFSRGSLGHYFRADYGRLRQIYSDFISKLQKNGITPIFVEDGPRVITKHDCWVARKYEEMNRDYIPYFEALECGMNPEELVDLFASEVIEDLGYKVNKSRSSIDADKAVAAFAEKFKAFAILANDSDYLVFQYSRDIAFLSSEYLDLDTFDTVAYDRHNLVKHLRWAYSMQKVLKLEHLPVLATLKGNDHFSFKRLQHFHDLILWFDRPDWNPKQSYPNPFFVIEELARYVAEKGDDLDLKKVSIDVFWRPTKAEALRKSIESYKITPEEIENPCGVTDSLGDETDPDWVELVKMAPTNLSNLMAGGLYLSPAMLEDYRTEFSWGLPKCAQVWENLRRRLYGILLYEKPNALDATKTKFNLTVSEYCMTGPGSLDEAKKQVPILPQNNNHPGLKKLWEGIDIRKIAIQEEDPLYELRWELFSHIINPYVDPKTFQAIPKEDLVLVCKLYYLQNEGKIPYLYDYEVKAFILTHLKAKQKDEYKLEIFLPEPRATQLVTTFLFKLMGKFVNATVGYVVPKKDMHVHKNFDGQMFHNFVKNFKNGTQEVKEIDQAKFDRYFDIITFQGEKVLQEKTVEFCSKSLYDETMLEDPWSDYQNYEVSSKQMHYYDMMYE